MQNPKPAPEELPRVQLRVRFLPFAVGLLVFLQIFFPNKIWFAFLITFGGLWLIAWFWSHSLAGGMYLQREFRFGWAQVGDELEDRFSIFNNGIMPAVWVEILDESTLPSYNPSYVTGVGGFGSYRWHTKAVCSRRGVYTLGPTTLRSGDPFGIYVTERRYPVSSTMAVMPPLLPLPAIEVAPGGHAGDGRPRSGAPERTVGASSVRDYVPGDSLRWIHWRTSARKNSLYVRLFDGAPVGDWWIFLDLERGTQAGSGENSTLEHAIVLAASLASRGINEGRAVGIVAQSSGELFWIPPQEGIGRLWELMRTLAVLEPGERPVGDLLAQLRGREGARSSLILITPDGNGRWLEPLLVLERSGVKPTVLLLDTATYGGRPGAAGLGRVLTDAEIHNYVFTRDSMDRPELHPGRQGKLEWRVTPWGRAVLTGSSGDLTWKVSP